MRSRRVVRLRGRPAKRSAVFGYTYADVAGLLGLSEAAVRLRKSRGSLDPSDLEGLAKEWARRKGWIPPPSGSSG